MADDERTGTCIICFARDPAPELTPVCGPCRSRLAGQLRDIPVLVDELRGEVLVDLTEGPERIEEKADHLLELDGELAAVVRIEHLHQIDVHAGAVPGQSGAPRVHGSREAPVPISVDRVDLLAAADGRTVHSSHMVPKVRVWYDPELPDKDGFVFGWHRELVRDGHGQVVMVPAGDQTGYPSAATVLDGWCAMFAEERRESTPKPEVPAQSKWLLDRLDELFKHPAVDEFAKEAADLWHVLRRAAGLTMPQPELCVGVPCKSIDCDLKTLWKVPGSDYVECSTCSRLYSATDYADWVALVAAAAKRRAA